MVVTILAVLKAGGAYVPLDPGHPAERLAAMLADAGVAALLVQERRRAGVPVTTGVHVVPVDDLRPPIGARRADNPTPRVTRQNLAYVIYTSGSTGVPKGVAVDHAALSRYLGWAVSMYPGHRTPLHSSYAFDMAVTSLFVPLLTGGCLEVVDETDAVERVAQRLAQGARYGLLKLAPTHLQALGDLLHDRPIAGSVDCLVVGGEALLGEHLEGWTHRFPNAVVVNEYGPTETVVGCCIDVRPLSEVEPGPLPIGRPAPGMQLYVLDDAGTPMPVGVPGELFIGGAQVARGYLARPALTGARFLPDPFGREPGARVYRTGDRVRWRADGSLEYLGRLDAQVKIRGFRVELGEVEAALAAAPGVRDARVLVREDVPGEKRLVAYVVGGAHADDLRFHLQATLPDYMVPSAFLRLDALPFTPNGKLDVRRLPAPDARGGAAFSPPRTPLEARVAEVWRQVLRVSDIGVRDNFFDLGGNSLLLYRVYRQLVEVRSDLRVVDLFRYPNVLELAAHLAMAEPSDTSPVAHSRARGRHRRTARQTRASG
jgi:amino acid adenylation domain-containing protein